MQDLLSWLWKSGVAAAIARGAWVAWTWYVARRDAQAGKRAIVGRGEISTALERLVDNTPADYAHIIHVHNGGGDLKAGLPMYMSCIHEEHRPGFRALKHDVQGLELDKHYRKMVATLIEVKDAAAAVADVDDELLQTVLAAMQARYARSILLRVTKKGIFFLRTTSSREALDDQQFQLAYRRTVSTLRKHY
ncbi:MAG: hypothetical protein AAFZ52_13910 [Bacteroidota bacterium]